MKEKLEVNFHMKEKLNQEIFKKLNQEKLKLQDK